MLSARNGSAAAFNRSKGLVHLAALAGFLVWFLGFMAVGGELFLMWQSETWNGQEPAFRFYVTILLVLIYEISARRRARCGLEPDREASGRG